MEKNSLLGNKQTNEQTNERTKERKNRWTDKLTQVKLEDLSAETDGPKKLIYFPINKKFIYHTKNYSMAKNSFLAELILKDSSILIASDVFGPKLGIQVFSRHTVWIILYSKKYRWMHIFKKTPDTPILGTFVALLIRQDCFQISDSVSFLNSWLHVINQKKMLRHTWDLLMQTDNEQTIGATITKNFQ